MKQKIFPIKSKLIYFVSCELGVSAKIKLLYSIQKLNLVTLSSVHYKHQETLYIFNPSNILAADLFEYI